MMKLWKTRWLKKLSALSFFTIQLSGRHWQLISVPFYTTDEVLGNFGISLTKCFQSFIQINKCFGTLVMNQPHSCSWPKVYLCPRTDLVYFSMSVLCPNSGQMNKNFDPYKCIKNLVTGEMCKGFQHQLWHAWNKANALDNKPWYIKFLHSLMLQSAHKAVLLLNELSQNIM